MTDKEIRVLDAEVAREVFGIEVLGYARLIPGASGLVFAPCAAQAETVPGQPVRPVYATGDPYDGAEPYGLIYGRLDADVGIVSRYVERESLDVLAQLHAWGWAWSMFSVPDHSSVRPGVTVAVARSVYAPSRIPGVGAADRPRYEGHGRTPGEAACRAALAVVRANPNPQTGALPEKA